MEPTSPNTAVKNYLVKMKFVVKAAIVLTAVLLLGFGSFFRILSQIASAESILKKQPEQQGQITAPTQGPKVCWLLSYPNSGTSYTTRLVGQASNTTVATNYGQECDLNGNGENVPVNSSSPQGPYLRHPEIPLPKHFILTKTHCGGRCNECGPRGYLETKESFMADCAKGYSVSSLFNLTTSRVTYNPKIAQRAIHLIRNPFNNLVSNFHLERHNKAKKGRTDWLQNHPNDVDGFRHWCRYLDAKYAVQEASERAFSPYTIELFQSIPCHKAFYVYAQVSICFHTELNLKVRANAAIIMQ